MRTFYTVRDIEDMVASGRTAFGIDESVVITDEARERSRKLGLKITLASSDRRPKRNVDHQTVTRPSTSRLCFYTAEDIVQIAAAGHTRLEIDANERLTDEASEKARKIGLTIDRVKKKSETIPESPAIEINKQEKETFNETASGKKRNIDLELVTKIKSEVRARMKTDGYDRLLEIIVPKILYRLEA